MPEAPQAGFAGTTRFSVNRLLGAGGMGMVYDVFDRERGERVALKLLRRADADTLSLFKQEFRALTDLAHPNLLSLYELFVVDGRWHFTMELLDGAVDFRRWVRRDEPGPTSTTADRARLETGADDTPTVMSPGAGAPGTPPASAVPTGIGPDDVPRLRAALVQLVEGVMALHASGMLHRDLKPENVLVTPDGRVRLLDFGLIADLKRSQGRVSGPASGSPGTSGVPDGSPHGGYVAGTVAYMSPEQAAALPLSPASDWYAVGVMLYEVLTGERPFTGAVKDVIERKKHEDPPAPSSVVAGVPADLERLCVALLSRGAASRPSGPEILSALGAPPSAGEALPADDWEADAPFVGRQDQLARLNRAFDHARAGHVAICRVHGRSGAGKSALLSHFHDVLTGRTDAVVLTGRCYEQEAVPYKAWDSLMDSLYQHLVRLPAPEMRALLPSSAAALARVFPVLKRFPAIRAAAEARGQGSDLREQRRLAFQALAQLLGRIAAAHPLVLSIDDLQWGDVDSATLLVELLQASAIGRMLVVVAHRTETPGRSACLDALTAAEAAGPAGAFRDVIEVPAMSEGETLQLALTLLGPGRPDARACAERILRESAGNAFFIVELARHVRAGLDLDGTAGLDLDAVLWARVQRLDDEPRQLLDVVAVAGLPIRVRDAAMAAGLTSPSQRIVGLLRTQRFVRTSGPGFDDEIECYHDRVRESVASRLDGEAKRACHARLAAVLEAGGVAGPETIATHLQHTEPARAASFFATAGAAAVEVLAFERAEEYLRQAVALAGSPADKARFQEQLIHFYADTARFRDAYDTGRAAVAAFGVRLPGGFSPPSFLLDCARARLRLGTRRIADVALLPELADERQRWAVRLISATAKSAFQVRPELCVAISAKAVNLCLRRGNIAESAVPYMVFGSIFLGGVLGRYRPGYEFGRLALDLVERFDNRKQRAEVCFVVGYFGTSWLRPAAEAEALWRRAHAAGLETGDLFHTGCAGAATSLSQLMRGVPLGDVWAETERHAAWLERVQQREPLGCVRAVRQSVRCLQGETMSPASFNDASFDEEAFVKDLGSFASRHFAHFYFVTKMLTLYLWREYGAAARTAEAAAEYLKASAGMLHSAEHLFLDALIRAAESGGNGSSPKRTLARASRKFRAWAARCPANFSHKHRLLAGEAARLAGDVAAARGHYEAAVGSAHKYGYLQVAGMANERWADMLDVGGERDEAERRRAAAREAWMAWGATGIAEACGRR